MNSEADQFNPYQTPASAQSEQSSQKQIHPDTLKFMGMAKDLLDSPEIKQSIALEQEKAEPSDSQESPISSAGSAGQANPTSSEEPESTTSPEEQPDTLDFRGMARDLLSNPARQSTEAES